MRSTLPLVYGLLLASTVHAQSFDALVDPLSSSSVIALETELSNRGTLIGNYDPSSNPGGTQTRLGLFGGSGNMPIPISLDLISASGGESAPEGAFGLELDVPGLAGSLSGLVLDLAPDSVFSSDASARLTYQTFRTVNPSCTYLSLGPVSLPVGEIGQIRDIMLVQTQPAALQLETTPEPTRYALAGALQALLSLRVETGFSPEPLVLSDLPVLLPLVGTLERSGLDRYQLVVTATPQASTGSLDLGGVELPPLPLALPCPFPPGTPDANLILNLNADALDFEFELAFELVAEAIERAKADLIFASGFEAH